jgi:hypothetical protein
MLGLYRTDVGQFLGLALEFEERNTAIAMLLNSLHASLAFAAYTYTPPNSLFSAIVACGRHHLGLCDLSTWSRTPPLRNLSTRPASIVCKSLPGSYLNHPQKIFKQRNHIQVLVSQPDLHCNSKECERPHQRIDIRGTFHSADALNLMALVEFIVERLPF